MSILKEVLRGACAGFRTQCLSLSLGLKLPPSCRSQRSAAAQLMRSQLTKPSSFFPPLSFAPSFAVGPFIGAFGSATRQKLPDSSPTTFVCERLRGGHGSGLERLHCGDQEKGMV